VGNDRINDDKKTSIVGGLDDHADADAEVRCGAHCLMTHI
jgi:hypothetical protein